MREYAHNEVSKHYPSKAIRVHQLDIPRSLHSRQRGPTFNQFQPNPSTKQKAITRHHVSPWISTPRLRPQRGARIIQASQSEYINSTSRSLPSCRKCPTFCRFEPNPSTKQEAIKRSLLSPQTSRSRIRPHRGVSIIRASPSESINSTSRSYSPSNVGSWHSINSNQTLPPSKKQSQDILNRHEQPHPNYAHNLVQALSKQAHPCSSTRNPTLTPCLKEGPSIPQMLPPRKKQSQDLLYRHGQAHTDYAHNKRQALSKQTHPSSST
uniref:Uncharacterized protein n=1 Tax=Cucumis melo TaxID=3656 RepID=A0A9I9DAP2_CUCME